MKIVSSALLSLAMLSGLAGAQSGFAITITAIPDSLLQQNYGKLPSGISGYDLNICNVGLSKQSIVSSEIYQALAQSNAGLRPIGRQIMLAAILRNQNHSKGAVITMILNSVTGVLSILSSSRLSPPTGIGTTAALGAIAAQQIMSTLKPVLISDKFEKFENDVLEPALVLDDGSCVERTVFATLVGQSTLQKAPVSFHIR